jgi:hypothetical protein
MDENILVMTGVFTALALVIAFGVVYNSARIMLSERGRELASLRVLGMTRGEVTYILLGELALQFTVDHKAEPEALAALGTRMLPESVVVDGIEVPTDVLERSYEPQIHLVAEAEAPVRKKRIDPIVPGVSVGHIAVSAGTLGCIVYDRHDATPTS